MPPIGAVALEHLGPPFGGSLMHVQSKVFLFGEDTMPSVLVHDILAPILLGAAVGLGTGILIWVTAVVRFGLEGWLFW